MSPIGILFVCAFVLVGCFEEKADRPVVEIPGLGSVRGITNWKTTIFGRLIHSFKGIRYGQPPSGPLRFKAPLAVEPWGDEVIEARRFGRKCVQSGSLKKEESGDFWDHISLLEDNVPENMRFQPEPDADDDIEDCLNLQIYTPFLESDRNLPVYVFFHGGAFSSGSSLIYWPQHLLDYDMVLVVPHYRLGPLGFMSLQNDAIPGNAGLMDQLLALEWVKQHIGAFGGDPQQITVGGQSAGGASVSLLAISPLTQGKGLFNRIISQSGSSITEWAIDRNPVYNAHGIAKHAGCDLEEDALVACFMSIDPMELTQAYKYGWLPEERIQGRSGFGGCSPVVQTNENGPKFLEKMPIEYWQDENFTPVPAMYGATKHEGTYVMAIVYDGHMRPNNYINDTDFLKYRLVRAFIDLFELRDPGFVLQDSLEYEYVGVDRLGNLSAMFPGLIDFSGAIMLRGSSFENLKLHAKSSDSYFYAFNFLDRVTLWPFIGSFDVRQIPFPGGICHGTDLMFIFNIPIASDVVTEKEKNMAAQMSKIYFNYVKWGDPTPMVHPVANVPTWPAYSVGSDEYMRFDKEENVVLKNFKQEYTIGREENFALGNNS